MVSRHLAFVAASLAFVGDAGAFAPTATPTLEAARAAGVGPLRTGRDLRFERRASAAWQRFATTGQWFAAWDRATGVPNRIWGAGLAAPGASASPAIAEAFARRVLAEHLALLAPGARVDDFVLVSNHDDGRIRSIGFAQYANGRRVIGGQIGFRFLRDRLFVISSEALPHVRVETATASDAVVLPLVGDDSVHGYRLAREVRVAGDRLEYRDALSDAVLATRSLRLYANGTLHYRGVDRHPLRGRVDRPAPYAVVDLGGTEVRTGASGTVSWTDDAPRALVTSVRGTRVVVENLAPGGPPAATFTLAPGGTVTWDASADGHVDAAVVTYLAVNTAKEYVRAHVDPAFPGIDVPIRARVNSDGACNAFFDGTAINFLRASVACQNTGLLDDVVFHEYAHALHAAELLPGVGELDVATAEGAADFLAASVTGDPGTARGFDYTDAALRDLSERRTWPEDIGEVHATGMILGGALWDLRRALIASLGEAAGIARTNQLYLAILRRASSIPSALVEALAADDDDGDLANGTPNECAIRDAFGRHGLRTAFAQLDAPGALPASTDAETPIALELGGRSRCDADQVERAMLVWAPGATTGPVAGTRLMVERTPGRFTAALPLPTEAPVYYAIKLLFRDGTTRTFADNLADSYYALYRGDTVPLYCTSFDDGDPFAAGWTAGTDGWQHGVPRGGATDPPAAFSGTHVLAQALGGDYLPGASTWLALPTLDVRPWSDVRLQYRRWLAVEDPQGDQARISVSGAQAWIPGRRDDTTDLHHVDREWRFHDVPVSGYGSPAALDVRFELAANGSRQFGGWALDDVCIVANVHSVCGDGVRQPREACDDGMATDACSAECARITTPPVDETPPTDGCCSGQRAPSGAGLVIAALAFARARRSARSRGSARGSCGATRDR